METSDSSARQATSIVHRWCGDLPTNAYNKAIELLSAAKISSRERDNRIIAAQNILLDRLMKPSGGGLGQRLVQFHEYLYDRLSYAHVFRDSKALDEVVWTLKELHAFCLWLEGSEGSANSAGDYA